MYNQSTQSRANLEELIAKCANADPDEAHTPSIPYNAPFTARNSVKQEDNPHVPIDVDSEDDFDQSDYDAYGYAGNSLKTGKPPQHPPTCYI